MVLESTFRLARDAKLEEEGDSLLLFLPVKTTQAPLKFPSELKDTLERLGSDFFSGSRLESLFTRDVPDDDLIARYFYLESLRNNGFLCERIGIDGKNLVEIVPSRSGKRPSLRASAQYKLSRFAYLHQENGAVVLESPLSFHKMVFFDERIFRLLFLLSGGIRPGEMAEAQSGFDNRVTCEIISLLLSCAFVVSSEEPAGQKEDAFPLDMWEFHDLLFQSRSRLGRHRNALGPTYRFLGAMPPLPVVPPPVSATIIPLETPDMETLEKNDTPFSAVLENRTSVRDYADTPLDLSQLSELLFRAARIKYIPKGDRHGEVAFGPCPGGGAIHELEIYPLVKGCRGLGAGLYRYNPKAHQLERKSGITKDLETMIWGAAMSMVKKDPKDIQVLLLLTSRLPRLSFKYQSIAYATTLKGLGCLYQTLYLVATAMDLGPCALGSGDSDLFAKATGIDYYAEPLIGEFVIGRPRE